MTQEAFQIFRKTIPSAPGVYKYYDASQRIIYIGKAKDLKKRISSYFVKHTKYNKGYELVPRIERIEFTVVNNEQDAFLLENTLIKHHKPLFNVMLKDDKAYPYIVITNDPFPRVLYTRQKKKDKGIYFGPFPPSSSIKILLSFIKKNFFIRNCTLSLTEKNIQQKKFKVCLEYHLGNCKGPCVGLQSQISYNKQIEQITHLLKGHLNPLFHYLQKEMNHAVSILAFEEADRIKKAIQVLKEYQSQSMVLIPDEQFHADVFAFIQDNKKGFVYYLHVIHGHIVHSFAQILSIPIPHDPSTPLLYAITQLREKFHSQAPTIIIPLALEWEISGVQTIVAPKRGIHKKLLDLALQNAMITQKNDQHFNKLHLKDEQDKMPILIRLQSLLTLQQLPSHIECFDNSHIQGAHLVGAMVCFKNGLPSKKDYRHFILKTVQENNDFAAMKEIVFRRYQRLLKENAPLPQLIIIDGGIGQLHAAIESIEALALLKQIEVVALAKKEETIYSIAHPPLQLNKEDPALLLLRNIRDEVHQTVITFHRKRRDTHTLIDTFNGLPVGKKTMQLLRNHFHSFETLKESSIEAVQSLIGEKKATIIFNFLKNEHLI